MTAEALLAESAVPRLLRGVRVHQDTVRGREVLLAPERVFMLDGPGAAVLAEVDGARSFGTIVDRLAEKFNAPRDQIAGDAGRFLQSLIERRMMEAA